MRFAWIPETKQWNPFWYAPKDQCDNYRECGPYGICDSNASPVCKCMRGFHPKNIDAWNLRDGSGGCVRRTALDCLKDKFLHMKNMKLPESTTSFVDRSMSLKDCELLCSRNCSCTAYANANISNGGSGCVIWTGELFDLRQFLEGGQDLYVRLAASDIGNGGRAGAIIIGIAVGIGFLILALSGFSIWKRKRLMSVCNGKTQHKGPAERSQDLLLNEVWRQWKDGKGLEVLDTAVGASYSPCEVLRCIQPKTPGYCLGRNPFETDSSSSKQDESFTVNQVTVTVLDARQTLLKTG
ncbi:unnamed protein product [Dovyalis caffra]|uniref:Apple domain-containing protein n=1 Tax=Dovyalis caffra TaxID=77055 RepID=A0AAV1SKK5_9ROSI|nr:unnamed protein product [Dovyalis caffra]